MSIVCLGHVPFDLSWLGYHFRFECVECVESESGANFSLVKVGLVENLAYLYGSAYGLPYGLANFRETETEIRNVFIEMSRLRRQKN